MWSSVLLIIANAAILTVGTPTPADSAPRYKCTSLAATGGTNTPPVKVGIVEIPTVGLGGTSTGTNKVLVCCAASEAGVGGLPSATCYGGASDKLHLPVSGMND